MDTAIDPIAPDPTPGPAPSLDEIRAQVSRLEAAHKAQGLVLSGRIIHVCHHLPVEIIRVVPPASPDDTTQHLAPTTQEFKPEDHDTSTESHDAKWRIHARKAHTAMVSGMRSLSQTHEQIVVAWTGEVILQTQSTPTPQLDRFSALPLLSTGSGMNGEMNGGFKKPPEHPLRVFGGVFDHEEKSEVESELNRFTEVEAQAEHGGKLRYVPVFLPPDVSKGHYEGFCKKSESAVHTVSPSHKANSV